MDKKKQVHKQSIRPLRFAELRKLATRVLQAPGPKCFVCTMKPVLAAINQCIRDGTSMIGLARALQEKGYAVTLSKLRSHRDAGHHIIRKH